MIVNNRTLLPAATAHENDVISSRIAIITKSLQKKQGPPRFVGGIWDIDDNLDTAEDVANRDSVHVQLKTMLQSEDPYIEIDNRMDTAAKIPEVIKKKNINEVSLERSKRCRTSSKTEVYPLQSSFDVEYLRAVISKDPRSVEGSNAEPIVSEVDYNVLPQAPDLNSFATSKEDPQQQLKKDINDDATQKDGIGLMVEGQNFYEKEINVLQKVILILKTHNNDVKELSEEEFGQLQKICLVLKKLGNTSHCLCNGTLDDNKSVAGGDLASKAALTVNGICHNKYQSTELINPIKDNLKPVINEDVVSIPEDPCGSASHSVDSNKKLESVSVSNAEVVLNSSSFYQFEEPKSPECKKPFKDNVTMMKDAVPSSPPKYTPYHLRSKSASSSGDEALRTKQGFQGFRAEAKPPQNHLRSPSKTRDASFPYQVKERKSTEIENSIKSNITVKTDISNQKAHGFKTQAFSNWKKHSNINTDSSRFNPSEYSDSFKTNRTAKANDRRQPLKDRTIFNNDLKTEKSAYGVQHSDNAMISLKIFDNQNAVVDEQTLPLNELVQRIKNFPSLSDVIPGIGEKDRELLISGSAVKVFLGCVFTASAITIPTWEVALEAYYLAKKYGIAKLQDQCKDYFNFKPIHLSQVEGIVQIARNFQITDALKNSAIFPIHNISDSTQPLTIKEQKCTVSCTLYVDPSEYPVPLYYIKETGLGSTIESDIHNHITFEPKSGTFCLKGLQIKLEAEKTTDFRKEVIIFCNVYKSDKKIFDLEINKPLKKLMIIDFKQRLLVVPGESATISVLIEDTCMRMCHCLATEKEFGRCDGGDFEISFASDRKSGTKQPLFFVDKLLYTFEGQRN